ncbi:MAG: monovalent cation/H(+) antiporter subunit G [Thermotaleaceae bacterium]
MIAAFLLVLSWFYILWGLYGLYKLPSIYSRFFAAGFIDTMAFITLIFALMLKSGLSEFTFRLILVLLFMMITTPISTHLIVRSAYFGGTPIKEEDS